MHDAIKKQDEEERRSLQKYIFELEEIQEKAEELSHEHEQLKHSQDLLMAILRGTIHGICLLRDRKFVWCNKAFTDILGWKREELIGKTTRIIYQDTEEYKRAGKITYRKSHKIGLIVYEYEYMHKNGHRVPCLVTGRALDEKDQSRGHVFSFTDFTERKRSREAIEKTNIKLEERSAELILLNKQLNRQIKERKKADEELKLSEERLKIILNSIQAGVIVVDPETHCIVDVNDAAIKMTGADRERIVGSICHKYMCLAEKGRCPITDLEQNLDNSERMLLTSSGKEVPILKTVVSIILSGRKHLLESFIDISERVQAEGALKQAYQELQDTQAQLIQSGKLASIGELASGVAHELNQPLMVIRGMAQLVRRSIGKNGLSTNELMEQLEPIERNTKRMMNIINHLSTFSRQPQSDFSSVDINKTIEESFLMLSEQLRLHNIEVKKDLDANLPKVKGEANQLEQVILNIITNARDAVADCRLNIENSRIKKAEYKGMLEIITKKNQNFVEILIRDNGGGIPAEKLEKIFDPFFTTKEVGKGTGLGLSISYGIIKDHQGEIEVAETGPEGTTFKIKLPSIEK